MKKSILAFCATAAALLLAGCQKEIISVVESAEATHTVVFTAEKMVETKTAIASEENGKVSYKWTAGDEARMYITETYASGENTVTNTGTVTGMTLSNEDKTATFTVSFSGAKPTGTVSYKAAYAGSYSSGHNPLIPSAQAPLKASFDPDADVMVSDVITKTARESSFRFNMIRKVSVNKMTLKGLTPYEKVQSVTFESDKNHSAYYNLADNDYSSPYEKKLTLTYTADNTVPTSGEFPVYFTTAPVTDATFTVTVVTDQHRYSKTSSPKTISFNLREVRRFGVNLADCIQPEGKVFTLVTNVNQLQIGAEVVIATNGSNDIAMSTTQNDNNRGSTEATKNTDYTTITITDQVQVFTLVQGVSPDTYAFSFDDNGTTSYLYAASSSKNYLRSQSSLDANGSWAITISNKEATITAQGSNTHNNLRYNPSNDIFSCYAPGKEQTVYIYQASTLLNPGMSWSVNSATAYITTASGIVFTAPTLNPGNATSVSYQSSNPAVATVASNGEVTIAGVGEATISAIFEGDANYAPQTVSYALTVEDNRETVETPSFNPASGVVEANTTVTISTETSGATIHYTTDGSNPTTASPVYSTPIVITAATTINAIAVKENYKNSEVGTATYTIQGSSTDTPITVSSNHLGSASTTPTVMDSEISYFNSANNTYSNPLRIYAGNTFTITSQTKNIVKIVYTCNSSEYANNLNDASFVVDATASARVLVSGNVVIVTITGPTKSVAAVMSKQVRINEIAVTYQTDPGTGDGPKSVTYTVASTSTVSTTGIAPSGSTASYSQTYTTAGQMIKDNSITLTLSGFDGKKITNAIVSVHSNNSSGTGSLSLVTGSTQLANIPDSKFNSGYWNGNWSSSFVDKSLSISEVTIGANNDIVLTINASSSSLYFKSLTLIYE